MTIKAEYDKLSADRSPYLQRARECSKFTLPWLIPVQGANGSTRLRVTYSSFGARCVNSLANNLLLALFPARQSFFKLTLSEAVKAALGGDKKKAAIDKALASYEGIILNEINSTPTRTPAGEALKHLLVAGNVLVYLQPSGGLKSFPIGQYVVKRDQAGNPLTIILEERVSLVALPERIREQVRLALKAKGQKDGEDNLAIYTLITRDPSKLPDIANASLPKGITGRWFARQEVEGVHISDSDGDYPEDECPWLPLRWIPDPTGAYGRGLVEDYLGHLVSLESLTASLVKATAVAAKVVFLRNPNSSINAKKLTAAETGSVVDGKIEDIMALQVDKRIDLATARQMVQDLKEELAYAFALNQAIQRDAERVTAEEIRFMAQQLDATLGGNYSTLSMDFQLPFLRCLMRNMEKAQKLPALPKAALKPIITTGLDALGRGAELDNLRAFVKDVVELGGPEALDTELNFGDLLTRLSTARGLVTDGLIKTPEEKQAAQQQKQQAAMMQQLGPNAVNAIGGMAKQAVANGAAAPTPT